MFIYEDNFLQKDQSGFTIVELLIATMIFSLILLLCTFGIIEIGKNYYKGITLVRTQNVARSVMDDITQAIQFGSFDASTSSIEVPDTTTSGNICIGNKKYAFTKNLEVVDSSTKAFTVDKVDIGCNPVLANSERELLGTNMRLARLYIHKNDTDYDVTIKVMYGDDDLIVDDSGDEANSGSFNPIEARCKGGVGNQFCASSELSTTITRRVN